MIEIANPSRTARLEIAASKAPKKYGDGVYRFGDAARLMLARGWTEVKHVDRDFFHGGSYSYLRSPPDFRGKPPFKIDIVIPSEIQILALADEVHRDGREWADWVGEWPCVYIPSHEERLLQQMVDPVVAKPIEEPLVKTYMTTPRFEIGYALLWNVGIEWAEGTRKVFGTFDPIGVDRQATLPLAVTQRGMVAMLPEEITGIVFEGAVEQVLVNKYERNPKARSACIAHYGSVCVVCHFDFEKHYGSVASGFIHVHHLVPISTIGKEYELDPICDLRPVCPNCHAVIHFRNPPFTIDEVKKFRAVVSSAMGPAAPRL